MTSTGGRWRSVPGPALSRPRYGGLFVIAIGPVVSRAARYASDRGITCITGPREGRRFSRISFCSAGAITARFTRKAIASRERRTARCGSPDLTGARCPTSRQHPRCPRIRSGRLRDVTPPMVFVSARTQRALPGAGSASISAGRSTCFTRPRFRGNAETPGVVPSAPPARGGLPAQASVSTALPGYLRAIRSAATCAISVHGRSTLMCGASWPAATRSARRRRPIAAGSLPSSAKI